MILALTRKMGTGSARTELNGRFLEVHAPRQGDGEGFCPVELLMAALSSCMHLTMLAVAEAKGITIPSLDVEVRLEDESALEEERQALVEVEVVFGPGLTDREKTILFRSGRLCPVRKLLSHHVRFQDSYRALSA